MAKILALGVDGGNSSTRALLLDGNTVPLGYGLGGNANHQGQGYDAAVGHVLDATRAACAQAGVEMRDLQYVHFALAGDDVQDDDVALRRELAAAFPGIRFGLSNDVWAGLRAGSPSGIGVAVNCGSGCGVVGRAPDGRESMIADLGYLFGDSGGGGQIASDAIRAVVRAWDGRGPATMLTGAILEVTDQPDVEALYLALYRGKVRLHSPDRRLRAAIAPRVFAAAAAGDEVARGILTHIGDELGLAGAVIARRLDLTGDAFTFVLTGGVFRTLESDLARTAIARLRTVAPRCEPTLPLIQPVAGAALQALDAAGVAVDAAQYALLAERGYAWHPEERFT